MVILKEDLHTYVSFAVAICGTGSSGYLMPQGLFRFPKQLTQQILFEVVIHQLPLLTWIS